MTARVVPGLVCTVILNWNGLADKGRVYPVLPTARLPAQHAAGGRQRLDRRIGGRAA